MIFNFIVKLKIGYRELYLDGNELQCEGAMELVKLCADHAVTEAYLREEELKRKEEEEALKKEQGLCIFI